MATVASCLSMERGGKSVRGLWREGKWGCSLRPHHGSPRRTEDTGQIRPWRHLKKMRASLSRGQGRVCEPYLRGTSRDEAARIWHLEACLSVSERTLCDKQMCLSR